MTLRACLSIAAGLIWLSAVSSATALDPDPGSPRIVSLAPHLTELAYDAGIEEALVGVVEWSDYPAAARSLPRIGDAFRFDLERILRLEATHALAWSGGTPTGAIAKLRALGVSVEVVETRNLDQIATAIERLGELGGNPASAMAAAANFRARLSSLRSRSGTGALLVPVFYQVSDKPLFTLGARHVINEVLGLCGGVNIFAELDTEAASVDLEAVLARDPLAIIAGSDGRTDPLAHWQAYPNLRAIECGNLLQVDPATLVRPTPRLLDGAEELCSWLNLEVRRAEQPACGTSAD